MKITSITIKQHGKVIKATTKEIKAIEKTHKIKSIGGLFIATMKIKG